MFARTRRNPQRPLALPAIDLTAILRRCCSRRAAPGCGFRSTARIGAVGFGHGSPLVSPGNRVGHPPARRQPTRGLDATLESIDRLNPDLNAIIWRNDDEARRDAKKLGDDIVAGKGELGRFSGSRSHQGPDVGQGLADDLRFPRGTGGAERGGRAGGGRPAACRVHPHRSYQHPELGPITVTRTSATASPATRGTPTTHRAARAGCGRRRGGRDVPARPRERRRRLDPHPLVVLRTLRTQTVALAGACGRARLARRSRRGRRRALGG